MDIATLAAWMATLAKEGGEAAMQAIRLLGKLDDLSSDDRAGLERLPRDAQASEIIGALTVQPGDGSGNALATGGSGGSARSLLGGSTGGAGGSATANARASAGLQAKKK